ncbi:ATP-binding protein [Tengunoibacter tsumagoiensis]|uniref:histidine kinase n=1 Tax=Tengunoibacter tsumagoiensis TaxID=2014871 RepID=A0A401ZVI1_9CHLR|nr:ATP-binding protein [Tengunoibacter tsumagoiensis]GCE10857.1 hypothetical protein KTT_07160 [Tengunoibacter tsumagoiensis]
MTDALLRLAGRKETYRNLLYLILTLPLGILSFALVITSLCFGLLSVNLVCIPFAILSFYCMWKLAVLERWMAINWLETEIPPMATPFPSTANYFQRIQIHLGRGVTWKSIVFLLLKLPGAIFSFYIVVMALILIVVFGLVGLVLGILTAPFACLATILTHGRVNATRYLLLAGTGFGLTLSPLYVTNTLAMLWGELARVMLGMSDSAHQLLLATTMAEQERAKAIRAEKSRSDLIVNVSHELRTPVASIRGHIESLLIACQESENHVPAAETLQQYLSIVHRESIRLGTLFDDLLAVARTEAHELRVELAPVAVGEIVEEVYQTLMPLARRERQITLIHEVAASLPMVSADRQRLTQVLLNLVRNAITYTPDGGIVSIALHYADDPNRIELSVSDTGIGIPEAELDQIFERFYRTDHSRTRSSGGFGLGLSIVRDFVIAMGGQMSVESTVGSGSTFRVQLRCATALQPAQSSISGLSNSGLVL